MSNYLNQAEANDKKLKVDRIMAATRYLIGTLKESYNDKKVWAGFRKKLRRIL